MTDPKDNIIKMQTDLIKEQGELIQMHKDNEVLRRRVIEIDETIISTQKELIASLTERLNNG